MTFEEKLKILGLLGLGKTQLPERLNKCQRLGLICSPGISMGRPTEQAETALRDFGLTLIGISWKDSKSLTAI